jgi:GST-like protein
MANSKIKLYTAPAPNGRKVSIALEELSLPYEVISVDLAAGDQREEVFLALNPNNKIPVIEDDGQVIWESGAILLHLAEKYKGLLPEDPQGRMEAIQYAFFQTGGIGPNLGRLGGELRKPEEERNEAMVEIFGAEVDRLLCVLDRILDDGRPYLAREYSIGDIMHFGWLGMALPMKLPLVMKHEPVVAWLERIAGRPAVVRGMQVP